MAVLVTGSVAVDHIMIFQDHFKNHFVSDKLEKLNVAFHVPSMTKQFGGTGANIAYNLCRLGIEPILLATVGQDLGAYANWMDKSGIRRDHLRVLDDEYTAACFITTDIGNNQIISFHPGAMDRAHEARIADVRAPFDAAIVSPNGRQAMLDYSCDLKSRNLNGAPGQKSRPVPFILRVKRYQSVNCAILSSNSALPSSNVPALSKKTSLAALTSGKNLEPV